MGIFNNKALLVNTNQVTGDVEVSGEFQSLPQANHAASVIAHSQPNVALERRDHEDDTVEYDYLRPNNKEQTQYDLNTIMSVRSNDLA